MANLDDVARAMKLNQQACKRADNERNKLVELAEKFVKQFQEEGLHISIQPYGRANYIYAVTGNNSRTHCLFDGAKLKQIGPVMGTNVSGKYERAILYECSKHQFHKYCLPPTKDELEDIEQRERKIFFK